MTHLPAALAIECPSCGAPAHRACDTDQDSREMTLRLENSGGAVVHLTRVRALEQRNAETGTIR